MVTHQTTFRALADPTRRAILRRLALGPLTAGRLAGAFPVSRPAVSKHLRVLRHARLVSEERSGRERLYRLDPRPLAGVEDWLQFYRQFWQARLTDLKRHVETQGRSAS